ncbi:MAG: DHA2 family efflux MFS transporter permease subunit [Syntrophomonas sp.]|nr:DHA2 family efflux MFS transporter permease subunit [Syntrophomonas sp.]
MNKPDTEKINWSILVVIVIGTFMAILDSSIVNVALPKMMTIFNASADQIQWILTAYMLTLGVIMPISGFLGDTFGYKRTYIVALTLFVIGSVLCGMSMGVNTMIAARIIQALGGGIMQPLGMALIYQSFPRSKIGMVLGFWGIAAMAAPAIGPTLGGYLIEYANWRSIFYINLPIGMLNLFLAGIILKETPLIKGKHFDFVGIATSIIGLFCILLALSDGTKYGWSSPFIVGLLSTSLITLTIFVFNELQHPEPILDLRMFKNFLFTMSVIIGSLLAMGMFGAIFLIPMLLQNVLGQTAMKTGLIMFPAAIASGVMMPLSGKLFDKYGAQGIVIVGLVLVTWTTYAMNGFNDLTPYAVMTVWLIIRGAGMGLSMMPVTTVGMNTVPPALIGRASALSNVIRQVASSFGIAMFTTIMQHRQVYHFSNMAQSVNINSNEYIHLQTTLSDMATSLGLGYGTTQGLGLSIIAKEIGKLSMIQAIDDCFIVAAALCLVALVMSLFLKEGEKIALPTESSLPLE